MGVICVKCIVSGNVQGVFYRKYAQQHANNIGITGSVRNRGDGKVEVIACGEEHRVESYCEWLWEGSPAATVSRVDISSIEYEIHEGFELR